MASITATLNTTPVTPQAAQLGTISTGLANTTFTPIQQNVVNPNRVILALNAVYIKHTISGAGAAAAVPTTGQLWPRRG